MDTLVKNSFKWLVNGSSTARIGAVGSTWDPNMLKRIRQELLSPSDGSASTFSSVDVIPMKIEEFAAGRLYDVDIVWLDANPRGTFAADQLSAITWFLQQSGKGLLVAGNAWTWASLQTRNNTFLNLPINRVLWPTGIALSTLQVSAPRPPTRDPPPLWPFYNTQYSIARINEEKTGGVPMPGANVFPYANAGLALLMACLPPRTAISQFPDLANVWYRLDQARTNTRAAAVGPTRVLDWLNTHPQYSLGAMMDAATTRTSDFAAIGASSSGSRSAPLYPGSVPAGTNRTTVSLSNMTLSYAPPNLNLTLPFAVQPLWRFTGAYAPPGAQLNVTLSSNAVNRGIMVQVGCHADDLTPKARWARVPYAANRFPVTNRNTLVGSPMGGPVYLLVPRFLVLTNVSSAWWDSERNQVGPWAEVENDRITLTVPSTAVRLLSDPSPLLAWWAQVLDSMAWLTNLRTRVRPERIALDADTLQGGLSPGYPIVAIDDEIQQEELINLQTLRSQGSWDLFAALAQSHVPTEMTFQERSNVSIAKWPFQLSQADAGDRKRARDMYFYGGAQWSRDWSGLAALDTLLMLKDGFTWTFYRNLYARYQSLSRPFPADNVQMWIRVTSLVANRTLLPFYEAWGFPILNSTRVALRGLANWTEAPLGLLDLSRRRRALQSLQAEGQAGVRSVALSLPDAGGAAGSATPSTTPNPILPAVSLEGCLEWVDVGYPQPLALQAATTLAPLPAAIAAAVASSAASAGGAGAWATLAQLPTAAAATEPAGSGNDGAVVAPQALALTGPLCAAAAPGPSAAQAPPASGTSRRLSSTQRGPQPQLQPHAQPRLITLGIRALAPESGRGRGSSSSAAVTWAGLGPGRDPAPDWLSSLRTRASVLGWRRALTLLAGSLLQGWDWRQPEDGSRGPQWRELGGAEGGAAVERAEAADVGARRQLRRRALEALAEPGCLGAGVLVRAAATALSGRRGGGFSDAPAYDVPYDTWGEQVVVVLVYGSYSASQAQVDAACLAASRADVCVERARVALAAAANATALKGGSGAGGPSGSSNTTAASPDGGSGGTGEEGSTAFVVTIAVLLPVAVLALAALALVYCLYRRLQRQHRREHSAQKAPGVGPLTTLLITDIANSTALWESLPEEVMDTALRLHHACIRALILRFNGYESATEGDSFILAFHHPMDAAKFALTAQIQLMDVMWPAEVLAHPDGHEVWVVPRNNEPSIHNTGQLVSTFNPNALDNSLRHASVEFNRRGSSWAALGKSFRAGSAGASVSVSAAATATGYGMAGPMRIGDLDHLASASDIDGEEMHAAAARGASKFRSFTSRVSTMLGLAPAPASSAATGAATGTTAGMSDRSNRGSSKVRHFLRSSISGLGSVTARSGRHASAQGMVGDGGAVTSPLARIPSSLARRRTADVCGNDMLPDRRSKSFAIAPAQATRQRAGGSLAAATAARFAASFSRGPGGGDTSSGVDGEDGSRAGTNTAPLMTSTSVGAAFNPALAVAPTGSFSTPRSLLKQALSFNRRHSSFRGGSRGRAIAAAGASTSAEPLMAAPVSVGAAVAAGAGGKRLHGSYAMPGDNTGRAHYHSQGQLSAVQLQLTSGAFEAIGMDAPYSREHSGSSSQHPNSGRENSGIVMSTDNIAMHMLSGPNAMTGGMGSTLGRGGRWAGGSTGGAAGATHASSDSAADSTARSGSGAFMALSPGTRIASTGQAGDELMGGPPGSHRLRSHSVPRDRPSDQEGTTAMGAGPSMPAVATAAAVSAATATAVMGTPGLAPLRRTLLRHHSTASSQYAEHLNHLRSNQLTPPPAHVISHYQRYANGSTVPGVAAAAHMDAHGVHTDASVAEAVGGGSHSSLGSSFPNPNNLAAAFCTAEGSTVTTGPLQPMSIIGGSTINSAGTGPMHGMSTIVGGHESSTATHDERQRLSTASDSQVMDALEFVARNGSKPNLAPPVVPPRMLTASTGDSGGASSGALTPQPHGPGSRAVSVPVWGPIDASRPSGSREEAGVQGDRAAQLLSPPVVQPPQRDRYRRSSAPPDVTSLAALVGPGAGSGAMAPGGSRSMAQPHPHVLANSHFPALGASPNSGGLVLRPSPLGIAGGSNTGPGGGGAGSTSMPLTFALLSSAQSSVSRVFESLQFNSTGGGRPASGGRPFSGLAARPASSARAGLSGGLERLVENDLFERQDISSTTSDYDDDANRHAGAQADRSSDLAGMTADRHSQPSATLTVHGGTAAATANAPESTSLPLVFRAAPASADAGGATGSPRLSAVLYRRAAGTADGGVSPGRRSAGSPFLQASRVRDRPASGSAISQVAAASAQAAGEAGANRYGDGAAGSAGAMSAPLNLSRLLRSRRDARVRSSPLIPHLGSGELRFSAPLAPILEPYTTTSRQASELELTRDLARPRPPSAVMAPHPSAGASTATAAAATVRSSAGDAANSSLAPAASPTTGPGTATGASMYDAGPRFGQPNSSANGAATGRMLASPAGSWGAGGGGDAPFPAPVSPRSSSPEVPGSRQSGGQPSTSQSQNHSQQSQSQSRSVSQTILQALSRPNILKQLTKAGRAGRAEAAAVSPAASGARGFYVRGSGASGGSSPPLGNMTPVDPRTGSSGTPGGGTTTASGGASFGVGGGNTNTASASLGFMRLDDPDNSGMGELSAIGMIDGPPLLPASHALLRAGEELDRPASRSYGRGQGCVHTLVTLDAGAQPSGSTGFAVHQGTGESSASRTLHNDARAAAAAAALCRDDGASPAPSPRHNVPLVVRTNKSQLELTSSGSAVFAGGGAGGMTSPGVASTAAGSATGGGEGGGGGHGHASAVALPPPSPAAAAAAARPASATIPELSPLAVATSGRMSFLGLQMLNRSRTVERGASMGEWQAASTDAGSGTLPMLAGALLECRSWREKCREEWPAAVRPAPPARCAYRGLRVRMGLHTGITTASDVTFNATTCHMAYGGTAMKVAKAVGDAASGGMILLSHSTFLALVSQFADLPGTPQAIFSAESDLGLGAESYSLYQLVHRELAQRLGYAAPLRNIPLTQLGTEDAPTGACAISFMHVASASMLVAELGQPGVEALQQFKSIACELCSRCGGYVVEASEGLCLAAFRHAAAALVWALSTREALEEHNWSTEVRRWYRFAAGNSSQPNVKGRGPRPRTGVHVGGVNVEVNAATGRMTYRGKVMNRTSRIAHKAASEQILCSREAWESVVTAIAATVQALEEEKMAELAAIEAAAVAVPEDDTESGTTYDDGDILSDLANLMASGEGNAVTPPRSNLLVSSGNSSGGGGGAAGGAVSGGSGGGGGNGTSKPSSPPAMEDVSLEDVLASEAAPRARPAQLANTLADALQTSRSASSKHLAAAAAAAAALGRRVTSFSTRSPGRVGASTATGTGMAAVGASGLGDLVDRHLSRAFSITALPPSPKAAAARVGSGPGAGAQVAARAGASTGPGTGAPNHLSTAASGAGARSQASLSPRPTAVQPSPSPHWTGSRSTTSRALARVGAALHQALGGSDPAAPPSFGRRSKPGPAGLLTAASLLLGVGEGGAAAGAGTGAATGGGVGAGAISSGGGGGAGAMSSGGGGGGAEESSLSSSRSTSTPAATLEWQALARLVGPKMELPPSKKLDAKFLGSYSLKGVKEEMRLFEVRWASEEAHTPGTVTDDTRTSAPRVGRASITGGPASSIARSVRAAFTRQATTLMPPSEPTTRGGGSQAAGSIAAAGAEAAAESSRGGAGSAGALGFMSIAGIVSATGAAGGNEGGASPRGSHRRASKGPQTTAAAASRGVSAAAARDAAIRVTSVTRAAARSGRPEASFGDAAGNTGNSAYSGDEFPTECVALHTVVANSRPPQSPHNSRSRSQSRSQSQGQTGVQTLSPPSSKPRQRALTQPQELLPGGPALGLPPGAAPQLQVPPSPSAGMGAGALAVTPRSILRQQSILVRTSDTEDASAAAGARSPRQKASASALFSGGAGLGESTRQPSGLIEAAVPGQGVVSTGLERLLPHSSHRLAESAGASQGSIALGPTSELSSGRRRMPASLGVTFADQALSSGPSPYGSPLPTHAQQSLLASGGGTGANVGGGFAASPSPSPSPDRRSPLMSSMTPSGLGPQRLPPSTGLEATPATYALAAASASSQEAHLLSGAGSRGSATAITPWGLMPSAAELAEAMDEGEDARPSPAGPGGDTAEASASALPHLPPPPSALYLLSPIDRRPGDHQEHQEGGRTAEDRPSGSRDQHEIEPQQ
ncbi:hypothetical protein HYH03_016678 [Edaphochlamys debaryana]|uniref:Guanylate cyclase domain-containing protein n=1 Tax=Edaphochlamys debaryana TaxID=47281 RepID=A0A836BRD4_9CHLO|nr:hypothetical protein HYH03_016678 [Edaphochlamys debaryana]|eukprot:KAG2484543.1 hypothetical protein HYH03_016678 [Edaphochlamys debaryana]